MISHSSAPYHEIDEDVWSAKLVSECLVEAIKMNNRITAGNGGAGTGLRDDLIDTPRPILTPDQIDRVHQVIEWQITYLQGKTASARMLALWLATKIYRARFSEICRRRGIPRATAYRLRDRGLTAIAIGLTADQIQPFRMGRLR